MKKIKTVNRMAPGKTFEADIVRKDGWPLWSAECRVCDWSEGGTSLRAASEAAKYHTRHTAHTTLISMTVKAGEEIKTKKERSKMINGPRIRRRENKKIKGVRCPQCGSDKVVQVADHCSHGYNGYRCGNCNCHWGN